jgi:hypothetical protein
MSDGLDAAVYAKQRPGAREILDGPQKQRIVAMVCSKPPEARARWTVRLIAEESVKRKLVPKVGRETIRVLLQSHELKPWREKMWWCAGMNRHGVEDERASRERSSDPLGPEFCIGRSSFENLQSGRRRRHHCGRQHDQQRYCERLASPA